MKSSFNRRKILVGFAFILLLAVAVFTALTLYMNVETEKDINEIARTYLQGMSREEQKFFDSYAQFQYGRIRRLERSMDALGEGAGAAQLMARARESAEFQEIPACAFIDEQGNLTSIRGEAILSLEDKDAALLRLKNGENASFSGYTESQQVVLFACPGAYPMEDGSVSLGVVYAHPMQTFAQEMKLDDTDSLSYYYIIHRDGSYLVNGRDTLASRFLARLLLYNQPRDMSAQEAILGVLDSMSAEEPFFFTAYYDFRGADGEIHDTRDLLGEPMSGSEWYLVTVLPYGVLDKTITDMSNSRSRGMFLAMGLLTAGILGLMLWALRLAARQIHALESANAASEQARQEAESAQRRAEHAQDLAQAAQAQAERAQADAEHANQAKSEFLSNMSHDIRTPMNAVLGMTNIALAHLDDPARVEDSLRKISLSGKQLLGLINDVLDMSKIESGRLSLNPELLSLREAMETIHNITLTQISAKEQSIDISVRDILSEYVYCDSVRLNQVLLNLLGNAVKFTPRGGKIRVALRQEPSLRGDKFVRCHFRVQDNGIGMSKEFQQRIFEAYSREEGRVRTTEGAGLGMTITKFIVDAMQGEILLDSEPGKGSAFTVILDMERGEPGTPETSILPPWRILLADDDKDLRDGVADAIQESGALPESCPDGETAVALVKRAMEEGSPYDAVLLDYRLPGMSGIETTRAIREAAGDKLPILLISAYDLSEMEERAQGAGISGLLSKPVFRSSLCRALNQFAPQEPDDEKEEDAAGRDPAEALNGMHILMAEDNEMNAEIAEMILTEFGATTDWAQDGKICLEKFEAAPPGTYQAILMDLRMPNMNGYEATRAIRALERPDGQSIPIVAMSADAFAEDVQKCLDAGMNGHVPKPIDVPLLISTLAKFL